MLQGRCRRKRSVAKIGRSFTEGTADEIIRHKIETAKPGGISHFLRNLFRFHLAKRFPIPAKFLESRTEFDLSVDEGKTRNITKSLDNSLLEGRKEIRKEEIYAVFETKGYKS